MRRFAAEELRDLYGSSSAYLSQYEDAVAGLVDNRWVLPADAQRMISTTARLHF